MNELKKLNDRKRALEIEYKELHRQYRERDYDWSISDSDYIEVYFPHLENEYAIICEKIRELSDPNK